MLLGGVITNIQLSRYKIVRSEKCTFCDESSETYLHLFYNCRYVANILLQLSAKWGIRKPSFQEVLFNQITENSSLKQDCIILIYKYYLYRAHCLKERVLFTGCENFIKQYVLTEEQIAKEKGKLNQHNVKWANLYC